MMRNIRWECWHRAAPEKGESYCVGLGYIEITVCSKLNIAQHLSDIEGHISLPVLRVC